MTSEVKDKSGKYCIPKVDTSIDWNWNLDGKDDNTSTSGKLTQCNPDRARMVSDSPVTTYSYCVLEGDWEKVVKCVDKSTGETQPTSVCKADTTGTKHYYKPKCDEKDSKEKCKATLE